MNSPRKVLTCLLALLAPPQLLGIALAASLPLLPAQAQKSKKPPPPARGEDFFILSSVDQAKRRLVLKLPTEVTRVMAVTGKTAYLDEQGKPIHLSELRAGDTVYVAHQPGNDADEIALRIRKGPMTVAELHRRYLKFP